MRYRIGEFAELSGVSTKTLRFYDEIGLLQPAFTDPRTRYRHYLPRQLQDLAGIQALKDLGVTLPEIRSTMSKTGAKKDRRQLLEDLRDSMTLSLQKAEQTLRWIHAAMDALEDVKPAIPVVVKHRPAARIASVRAQGETYMDILQCEAELLHALPDESTGALRGALWHSCADAGLIDGEPFVELKREIPRRSFYDVKQLPPVTVACAYSGLEEDEAEHAYSAIRDWMHVRGYRLAGPKREIYLDQMLEIQFPLQVA